jgi:hypothetical protein
MRIFSAKICPLASYTTKLARISRPFAFQTIGEIIRLDLFLQNIRWRVVSDNVCRRPLKRNYIFVSCFSRSHFLFATEKIGTPCRNGCSYEKGSLEKDMPSIGMLVGSLLATTGLAASALLEPSSTASSSWWGLCRRPDWDPHRLGAHALAPRVCSWRDQGRKPNSAASSTSGSSKIISCRRWSVCSNTLARFRGSLGGLLAAAQNWPIYYQKVSQISLLVGIFPCLERSLLESCWAL